MLGPQYLIAAHTHIHFRQRFYMSNTRRKISVGGGLYEESGGNVKSTNHLRLMPRLRMSGVISHCKCFGVHNKFSFIFSSRNCFCLQCSVSIFSSTKFVTVITDHQILRNLKDFFLCHQHSKQTVRFGRYLHNIDFTICTSTQILSG